MELITFRCTTCKQGLKVPADKAGRRVKCTKCGTSLVIPSQSEPDPAPVPRPAARPSVDEDDGPAIYGFQEAAHQPPTEEPPRRRIRDEDEEEELDEDEQEEIREKDEELRRRLLGLNEEGEEEEEEERREEEDEDEEARPRKTARRRGKAKLDAAVWNRVRVGLAVALGSVGTLAIAVLLHEIVVIIGLTAGSEYSKVIFQLHPHYNETAQVVTFRVTPDALQNLKEDMPPAAFARLGQLRDVPFSNQNQFRSQVLQKLGIPSNEAQQTDEQKALLNRIWAETTERNYPPPDMPRMIIGMVAGLNGLDTGMTLSRIAAVFVILQWLVFLAACFFFLGVPKDLYARALVVATLTIVSLNLVVAVVLMLLPLVGAMKYALLPLLGPEISLLSANDERLIPIAAIWSGNPFFQVLVTIFIVFFHLMAYVLFPLFLRAVGRLVKSEQLEENALSLVQLGLGLVFIEVAFYLMSMTGTSDVLGWVLKTIYCLGLGFFILQLVWLVLLLLKARVTIQKALEEQEE